MLVLVLDTSTAAVQAAVCRVDPAGVDLLAQRCTLGARAHGESLAPAVKQVLAETRTGPDDLAAIVAGTGPGPFTGLRVGLVTAAVMGQTLDIPTYGVCSLDGLGAATTGRTLVATDARRKEIYWARYVDGVRHDGPGVGRPDDIARRASAAGVDQAAGDGAVRYAAQLGLPVLERPRYPDPAVLVWLAADFVRSAAPTQPLNPIYLRRPDAVEPGRPKPVRQ